MMSRSFQVRGLPISPNPDSGLNLGIARWFLPRVALRGGIACSRVILALLGLTWKQSSSRIAQHKQSSREVFWELDNFKSRPVSNDVVAA